MWAFTGSARDSGKSSVGRRSKHLRSQKVGDERVYKKSAFSLEQVQDILIKFFHRTTGEEVVSADKRMIHARGPVWHRQQPQHGIIPAGRHGLDMDATWSDRKRDGWV
jgi:hypothetical protein